MSDFNLFGIKKLLARADKWDRRFLALAEHIAGWSKDPSTKVGAVIVDEEMRVMGVGYNGFARGVRDDPARYADRAVKLLRVVHAEPNAILNASRTRGCTIYTWPFPPCAQCASLIVQAGIVRVVAPGAAGERAVRWADSLAAAEEILTEAGVEVALL